MAAMNWDRNRRQAPVRERGGDPLDPPARAPKQRGITNAQAKLLGKLQRQLREPYTGNGMTLSEASSAIDDASVRLRRRNRSAA